MDTGVQTSPVRPPPSSSLPPPPPLPPQADTADGRRDASTHSCDLRAGDRLCADVAKVTDTSPADGGKPAGGGVRYRQFLEAERPDDGTDTGLLPVGNIGDAGDCDPIEPGHLKHDRRPQQIDDVQSSPCVGVGLAGDGSKWSGGTRPAAAASEQTEVSTVVYRKTSQAKPDDDTADCDKIPRQTESPGTVRSAQVGRLGTGPGENSQLGSLAPHPQRENHVKERGKNTGQLQREQADRPIRDHDGGDRHGQGRPPSERTLGVQQRSGGERSRKSDAMPPPQYSSSPARGSLTSAIGQVMCLCVVY